MQYWLFKSEPATFGIDHLVQSKHQVTHWEGVRNFQVRNMLRDQMQIGDQAFFYHSNCTPPGIVGVVEVVKAGYPDDSAWDPQSKYFDPKSSPEKPLWYMVNVRFLKKFSEIIPLEKLKSEPELQSMLVVRRGNRLSITPVTKEEWGIINKTLAK